MKYFSNTCMSNSMIFSDHFENMQIRSLGRHFSACQHWILDSAYQIIPNQGVKPFSSQMPVLVNFSDLFRTMVTIGSQLRLDVGMIYH